MALKRIKYCPAQSPILPWWEDVQGNEVKTGQVNFRAVYAGQRIIVIQMRGTTPVFIDDDTCEPVTVARGEDNSIWVEVEDESGN